jgi:RpiR family carbohydrate utilization transcriptional regulator
MRERISLVIDRLSPAERKVAELVAANPAGTMAATVASLAREAGVSEPTVIRFCRSLGFEGFADLRLALTRADAAAGAPSAGPRAIAAGTALPQAAATAIENAIAALAEARRLLDPAALDAAARALVGASRVEVWGSRDSVAASIALALLPFCRAGLARHDAAEMRLAARTLHGRDAVVCLSPAGDDPMLVDAAQAASRAGATVIALTRPGSPLGSLAGVLLPCAEAVPAWPDAPLATRYVQLAIGDALAAALAMLPKTAAPHARKTDP